MLHRYRLGWTLAMGSVCGLIGCSGGEAGEHEVYLSGYVYNGATGARLTKAQITAISIKYRDKLVNVKIEDDGRFLTTSPLPTWQDYDVSIGAPGFRPFVSRNAGFDVPASVATTEGIASANTTQTLQFEASLFPMDLKAPRLALTIDQADANATTPPPPRASGSIRLKPQSPSVLEGTPSVAPAGRRRWWNTEDLQTQTITRVFADGRAEIAEGELLYGVTYELTVFGVAGYQPAVLPEPLVAGQVSSRTIVIAKEQQDPLRIVLMDSETCVPPAGTSSDYGAVLNIDFNAAVEFVGTNASEEIDNGVSVTPSGSSFSSDICPLKMSTSPTVQERGTRTTNTGNRLTLAFNPSMAFANRSIGGFSCTAPASVTSVTYGNLAQVIVRPVGDQTRKRSLGELVGNYQGFGGGSGFAVTCGSRSQGF